MSMKKLLERIDSIEQTQKSLNESMRDPGGLPPGPEGRDIRAAERAKQLQKTPPKPPRTKDPVTKPVTGRPQGMAEDAGTGFGRGKIETKRAVDWLNDPRLETQVRKLTAPGALIEDPKKGFKAKVFNMGTGMGMNPMNEQYSEARNPMYFKDFLQEVIRDLGKGATVEANLENAPAPVMEKFGRGKHNLREGITQSLLDLFRSKEDILIRKAIEEIMNYHQTYRVMALKKAVELLKQEIAQGKSTQDSTDIVQTINRGMDDLELKEGLSKKKVEGKKPDYLDFDKDGDKKEPMTKALQDKKKMKKVKEGKIEKTATGRRHHGTYGTDHDVGQEDGQEDGQADEKKASAKKPQHTYDAPFGTTKIPPWKGPKTVHKISDVEPGQKSDSEGRRRGRPKKVTEMTDREFHGFMRGIMVLEEKMSPPQKAEKERIVKGMKKKGVSGLKKRYGERWQDVMHATATKLAMDSKGSKKK